MSRGHPRGLLDERLGWALLGGGAVALVLTMLAVLRPEGDEGVCSAQVWGGATSSSEASLLRVELTALHGPSAGACAGRSLQVSLKMADGAVVSEHRVTDEQGMAVVAFDGRRGVASVAVRSAAEVLAEGAVEVSSERFWRGVKSEGGLFASRRQGEYGLEVGVLDGVAVMGLPATIVVQVLSTDGRGGRVPLELEADGLEFDSGAPRVTVETDIRGLALLSARLTDLSAELMARVRLPQGPPLALRAAVPVRPGIRASRRADAVVFTSPVEHAFAHYALVGDAGWVTTGKVALGRTAPGLWEGTLSLPTHHPKASLWMVGTEPSLQGQNVLGWDLSAHPPPPRPRQSRVVPLLRWLDGRAMVEARILREHRRATRQATLVASGLLVLLVGTLGLLSWRSARQLRRHFVGEGVPHPATLLGSGAAVGWLYALLLVVGVALLWTWGQLRPSVSPPTEPSAAAPSQVGEPDVPSRGVRGPRSAGTTAQ